MTPFSRRLYGGWFDAGGWGQDARQQALEMASEIPVTRGGGRDIVTGLWVCMYSGVVLRDASNVDCDHLLALSEIHRIGGHAMSRAQRRMIANDQANLVCVAAGPNRSKQGKNAFWWMPPNIACWLAYLEAREAVRTKYGLGYGFGEKAAIAFFTAKARYHEKGVNLGRVRVWAGKYLGWVYSPI